MNNINIYNSLSRTKQEFIPLKEGCVFMYVCGPTVYGHAHLGHARCAVTFDIIHRYFRFLGYKVKLVRNYTDVGHLEFDADSGDDKIQKKAQQEQVDPLEIVQKYINSYRSDMNALNILPPAVEPQATTYILEQINIISKIIDQGFGYVVNGSVYFDVVKYNKEYKYGILSGRRIEDLLHETRDLNNQEEKKNSCDFALWKKADQKHIMHWTSPWSEGYPGWHTECVAIAQKLLGETIDIHGGGIDLQFPHHEAEIAQAYVINKKPLANFWVHNNLVNIGDKKMSKSLNNFITLQDLFYNEDNILGTTFDPMVLRFLFLQTHYRSTLSISKEALIAAQKGYCKLLNAYNSLLRIEIDYDVTEDAYNEDFESRVKILFANCFEALADDFNTPILLANMFEIVNIINDLESQKINLANIAVKSFEYLKTNFINIYEHILGFRPCTHSMEEKIILDLYANAKKKEDYTTVEFIRQELKKENKRIADFQTFSVLKYDF